MRWPWMSKDAHEQVVSTLRQKLAESEIERKRAQDELIRLLGGRPYNFPQPIEAQQAQVEDPGEPDPGEDEAAWLDYLRRFQPSRFQSALAQVLKRGPSSRIPQPPRSPEVSAAFDAAVEEVNHNQNGHHAATTT